MPMLIKWRPGGLKSPLSRARGLGSARSGVHHWIEQRFSAMANIPLCLWLVFSLVSLRGIDYAGFITWLGRPINSVLMICSIAAFFYHGWLGCQVVIEDYLQAEGAKTAKLWATKLTLMLLASACIFSVLKIAFAPIR